MYKTFSFKNYKTLNKYTLKYNEEKHSVEVYSKNSFLIGFQHAQFGKIIIY